MLSSCKAKSPGQQIWYFYWTRPIGAPEYHFRLALTTNPLWGCKHHFEALCSEISSSQACKKLEVIITSDTNSSQPLFVAENEWKIICQTLGVHHGSSLTSVKFIGLSQKQIMQMMDYLSEEKECQIQSVEIALSNDFPDETLQYLRRYCSSLKELHLLDPARSVKAFHFHGLRELIENTHHLRLLVVEPLIVVTSSEDDVSNHPNLDPLFYSIQLSVALEQVTFSFACVGQPQTKRKIRPRTLADLLKEQKGDSHPTLTFPRKESISAFAPQAVLCPKSISASKEKLEFALACNAFRRKFIEENATLCCGADEMLSVLEAGLRVLKDWMNQNECI